MIIYSNYLEQESQSSKWDRVRVDYELVKKVLRAKEYQTYTKGKKPKQK